MNKDKDELEQKRQLRTALLKKVHEMTNGTVKMAGVNGAEVAAQLGIRDGDVNDFKNAAAYLDGERLLKVTWVHSQFPGFMQLTHEGLKEIEAAIAAPDKPTEHLSPINFLYIAHAIGSNIQQGTIGSSQAINLSPDSLTPVKELMAKLSQSIPTLPLDENDKRELEAEVKTIQAQAESPKPKPPIIREGLISIRSILEKAAGSLIAVELAKQIEPLLRSLGF